MAKSTNVVDSIASLKDLLDKLATTPANPAPLEVPSLYFDIEGNNLGRNGSIDILSLFFLPEECTYLIDIHLLGSAAFSTKNDQEYSLTSILESPATPKVFFDVRNDSDALFSLYGISLVGIQDLQLMELAANTLRRCTSQYVCGLAKCIERDLEGTAEQKQKWLDAKEMVKQAFHSETGASPDVFKQRPIPQQVMTYCSQDVAYLPNLLKTYASKVCKPSGSGFWRYMVRKGSKNRVELSQSKSYDGQAKDKVLSPWDRQLIETESEEWNDDVIMLGVNDKCTLKELSFGIFRWV